MFSLSIREFYFQIHLLWINHFFILKFFILNVHFFLYQIQLQTLKLNFNIFLNFRGDYCLFRNPFSL